MQYISNDRHPIAFPKDFKKTPSKERIQFDKEREEIKQCIIEEREGITVYKIELVEDEDRG
jgi:hypothetical protein